MSNIKKQLLLLTLLLSTAINAFAVEVEIGGLWYDVITNAKEAKVIFVGQSIDGDIVIPESVEYDGVTCSVTSIGNSAFNGCSGLTSVTIGNSVTSIGASAFNGCSGLTSVTIGNSVTSIGNEAFYNCSKLISVTIGSGIKYIGYAAFAKCTKLTDVYCYAKSVPSTESNAFDGSYIEYVKLHVPTASIDAYKAAVPWSWFQIFVGLDGTLPDNPTEETKKCATPTISLVDGELQFSCETEGVEYVSEVSFVDGKQYFGSKVSLTGVYKVSVYATKSGYDNSDVATAKFTMSSGSGIKGDVNGDGKVDVSDVVGTANIILQKQ